MNDEQLDVLKSVVTLMEPVSVVGLYLTDFIKAFPEVPPNRLNDHVNYLIENGYVTYEDPPKSYGLCVTGLTSKGQQTIES